MTVPDPRVGEIEARLAAATPGPWGTMKSGLLGTRVVHEDGERVKLVTPALHKPVDAEFIANAPSDVSYLLAELRKAHEALTEAQAKAYDKGYTHGRHDGELSNFSRAQRPPKSRKNPYRAAVAAANGDGQ